MPDRGTARKYDVPRSSALRHIGAKENSDIKSAAWKAAIKTANIGGYI